MLPAKAQPVSLFIQIQDGALDGAERGASSWSTVGTSWIRQIIADHRWKRNASRKRGPPVVFARANVRSWNLKHEPETATMTEKMSGG